MNRTILALLFSALGVVSAVAQQPSTPASKPTIYNHVTKEGGPHDQAVKDAYAPKFTIVDIADSSAYTRPKPTAGSLPKEARDEAGSSVSGYVLIAYIVTIDGRATEPVVLKSTDKRLDSTALKAMEAWRFQPARLNGKPISTTAAQEFHFKFQ